MMEADFRIKLAETDAEIVDCLPVMAELRGSSDTASFLQQVRSQQDTGYRLAFLSDGGSPLAVAGFRIAENLAWGKHMVVDDLVTRSDSRSKGCGATLLTWLETFAHDHGATQIHLDSGTQRTAAHRFYLREGFEIRSFHFSRKW